MSAKNSIRWHGLDELRDDLRRLPEELRDEGAAIVYSHAISAQNEIVERYPEGRTGNLKAGVYATLNEYRKFGASALLRSRAPHAWIYEHGTKARNFIGTDKTGRKYRRGARRGDGNRGRMPKAPVERQAIPVIVRWRARMYAQLSAMLERHGLRVSGTVSAGARAA